MLDLGWRCRVESKMADALSMMSPVIGSGEQ